MPEDANSRSTNSAASASARLASRTVQAAGRFLLDDGHGPVPCRSERLHELLRISIVDDRDREVDVAREAWLGASRDGEAADERPTVSGRVDEGPRGTERLE